MDLEKLRAHRSVLKRTRPRPDLPKLALFVASQVGEGRRKVLDADQHEHVIDDAVLKSYFKVVGGSTADELIATHWPKAAKPAASAAASK